jgi:hypothetical protein
MVCMGLRWNHPNIGARKRIVVLSYLSKTNTLIIIRLKRLLVKALYYSGKINIYFSNNGTKEKSVCF